MEPDDEVEIRGAVLRAPLDQMELGSSFFVPATDPRATVAAFGGAFRRRKWGYLWRERIERGVLGVRFWRVV